MPTCRKTKRGCKATYNGFCGYHSYRDRGIMPISSTLQILLENNEVCEPSIKTVIELSKNII